MLIRLIISIISFATALIMLYAKYVVVFKGKKYHVKITGIKEVQVVTTRRTKSYALCVSINNKQLQTMKRFMSKKRAERYIGAEVYVYYNPSAPKWININEVVLPGYYGIELLSVCMILSSILILFCL